MITAWRLCKERHTATAFSGEGARIVGGRWNRPGTSVVFVAEHLSLAVLELFVHLDPRSQRALRLVCIPLEIPGGLIEDVASLPPEWRSVPPPLATMELGSVWAASGRSVALRVPSIVVPEEHNLVLAPSHPDFARITIGTPRPFSLDPRMWK